jgi:hypothetical protein
MSIAARCRSSASSVVRCIRQLLELPRQVAVRFATTLAARLLWASYPRFIPERALPVRAVWSLRPVSHPRVIEKVLERLIRQMVKR